MEGWLEAARGVERTAEAGEAGDAAVRAEIMVASSSADGGREREREGGGSGAAVATGGLLLPLRTHSEALAAWRGMRVAPARGVKREARGGSARGGARCSFPRVPRTWTGPRWGRVGREGAAASVKMAMVRFCSVRI